MASLYPAKQTIQLYLVPTHCQLVTKQFIIKPVNVLPSATTDVTQLNKIFKVEDDHVVLQNDDHLDDKPKRLSLKVSSNAILAEINKTKAQLDSSNSIHDFQIEGKKYLNSNTQFICFRSLWTFVNNWNHIGICLSIACINFHFDIL